MSHKQAIAHASMLVRGERGEIADAGKPRTVGEALEAYEELLRLDGGNVYNARGVRRRVPPHILALPVAALTAQMLADWLLGLRRAGMKAATAQRYTRPLKAALNRVADLDARIANRSAWTAGLAPAKIRGSHVDEEDTGEDYCDRVLDAPELVAVARAAAGLTPAQHVLVKVLIETGARMSQIARLRVADLQTRPNAARLLIPASDKGTSLHRRKVAVQISMHLAGLLRAGAVGRADNAPLLVDDEARAIDTKTRKHFYMSAVDTAVAAAGLAGREITSYWFRHSSIVRQLKCNMVSIDEIAMAHNTSVAMIRKHYARHVNAHNEAAFRAMVFDTGAVDTPAAAVA